MPQNFPKHSKMPRFRSQSHNSLENNQSSYTLQARTKILHLCLIAKLEIILANQPTTLKKQSKLTRKCCHKNKFKLNKLSTKLYMFELPPFFVCLLVCHLICLYL